MYKWLVSFIHLDIRQGAPIIPPFENVEVVIDIDFDLIIIIEIDWALIVDWVIETPDFVVVITPDTNPCDDSPDGDTQTLQLDGISNFLTFETDATNCLGNPQACDETGMTFRINLKLQAMEEDTYIMSSGGELTDVAGMSMFYKFGKYQVCFIRFLIYIFVTSKRSLSFINMFIISRLSYPPQHTPGHLNLNVKLYHWIFGILLRYLGKIRMA